MSDHPRNASCRWILRQIAGGSNIARACRELTKKGYTYIAPPQFLAWVERHPDRLEAYASARRRNVELRITRIHDYVERIHDPDPKTMAVLIAKAKLITEIARWEASKILPRLYGDKVSHEHQGNIAITVATGVPEQFTPNVIGVSTQQTAQPALPTPPAASTEPPVLSFDETGPPAETTDELDVTGRSVSTGQRFDTEDIDPADPFPPGEAVPVELRSSPMKRFHALKKVLRATSEMFQ